jgi:hypothetical protein
MKAMLKQYGIDQDEDMNEEDEYDKILKQMGVKVTGNENDDVMAIWNGKDDDDDMEEDDDAILAKYMPPELKPKSPRS